MRVNEQIDNPEIRLIDQTGDNCGVVDTADAQIRADEAGLDLVEIQPRSEPPVCKIMDYGKFKFAKQKRASEAKKKQRVISVKEVKLRPNIDDKDYSNKLESILSFLDEGDKVKVSLRFRGREINNRALADEVLSRVREDLREVARVETEPEMEGRQMVMVMGAIEEQRRPSEAKGEKTGFLREIKLRPNLSDRDYRTKLRSVRRFLNAGDKVRVSMRFRVGEDNPQDLAEKVLGRARENLREVARVETEPEMKGRQMVMVLGPNS